MQRAPKFVTMRPNFPNELTEIVSLERRSLDNNKYIYKGQISELNPHPIAGRFDPLSSLGEFPPVVRVQVV